MRSNPLSVAAVVSAGFLPTAQTAAQAIDAEVVPPIVDRWMYPFGSEAGTRASVPTFGAQNVCGPDARFDDRDAQFLVTFASETHIPPGWPAGAYRLTSAALIVRTGDATTFIYDPTPDPIESFLAPGSATVPCPPDPAFLPDADPGRPIELFAVAFRNGFTAATFGESSPFKPGSAFVPPWINVRNAYPIGFDPSGAVVDASNPIKARSLQFPLATGVSAALTPGQIAPDGAEFTFAIPVESPGVREYVQAGLSGGRVALLVTSLFEAQEQVAGSYPNFYTKEATPVIFPEAAPPRLVVTGYLCTPDFNGDGALDPDDLGDYINTYFASPPGLGADFNRDGAIDPDDLGDFINAYFAGCP